jgi:hypothetical protein
MLLRLPTGPEQRITSSVEGDANLGQVQNQDISSRRELLKMWMDQKVNQKFTDFDRSIQPQ